MDGGHLLNKHLIGGDVSSKQNIDISYNTYHEWW